MLRARFIGPLASRPQRLLAGAFAYARMIKNNGGLMTAPDLNRRASVSGKGSRVVTGWDLIGRQFLALFIKRFHYARRSRKGLVAQVTAAVRHADEGLSGEERVGGSKRGYVKYALALESRYDRGAVSESCGGERRREAIKAERNRRSLRSI